VARIIHSFQAAYTSHASDIRSIHPTAVSWSCCYCYTMHSPFGLCVQLTSTLAFSAQDHIPSQDFSGLLDLFEMALPGLLLYRFERPQFADLYHENHNRRWCKMYGAMHLLRLIGMLIFTRHGVSCAHTIDASIALLPELAVSCQLSGREALILVSHLFTTCRMSFAPPFSRCVVFRFRIIKCRCWYATSTSTEPLIYNLLTCPAPMAIGAEQVWLTNT
jgi:hypothetical protein